ncbi:polysaccharide deacetylase family protein [Sporomusa acidovorans]|uniref:NodB homology domain-containing protein n=1 Tax=Sporomusa acidovorans (strain ATCC 49682 / DSM 3132 / Mol) TaxID=1123286 RepID=A0ABZ3IW33_SPOA4|nr:polysaccharide deacetylase family protein [Sporomusa acidovorans]OZC23580.1 peptidoglycan-N-acetylglucosamine deacetylase [Sporomusa acidovorans DSM 3132]SDE21525.1 Peptidoglycan/xylan/chitin deacetylase, PgdA/CDA1 family [Sporomusa acidovorans]
MFDTKVRLISMLGLLTIIVVISLFLDYLRILRRPVRLGLSVAILGIIAGFVLTLNAVLPANHFYGPVISESRTNQKLVALTFDDGPYPPYTGQILDILKERQIPATFFVIGQNAAKYPDLIRRIAAEGHQLGNHTYHHVDLLKLDRQGIISEIEQTNQVIANTLGYAPHVIRPPHGFRDAVVMNVMAEYQLKVVEWSVSSRDWVNPGAEVIAERTLGKVHNGSIILLHDGDGIAAALPRAQTVAAARIIIDRLLAQGYKFVTVDEILKVSEE